MGRQVHGALTRPFMGGEGCKAETQGLALEHARTRSISLFFRRRACCWGTDGGQEGHGRRACEKEPGQPGETSVSLLARPGSRHHWSPLLLFFGERLLRLSVIPLDCAHRLRNSIVSQPHPIQIRPPTRPSPRSASPSPDLTFPHAPCWLRHRLLGR